MVLNHNNNIVLLCLLNQDLVLFKELNCRLCDQNMDASLNSIKSNVEMGRIRCKNGNGITAGQIVVDSLLVYPSQI